VTAHRLRSIDAQEAAASSLTLAEATRIVREATKDKTYQRFPLGQDAAGYLRAKRKRLTPHPSATTKVASTSLPATTST